MEFKFPTWSRRTMGDDESGLTAKQKGRLAALRSAKEVLGEDASSKDVRDLADYILGESDESAPALEDTESEEPDEEAEDEDAEEEEDDDSDDDDGEDNGDDEEPAKKAASKRTARKAPAKKVTRSRRS